MGREQLEALLKILEQQLQADDAGLALGTWNIRYDKERNAFYFDKCEFEGYCEERPAVFRLDGRVLDRGGPLLSA